MVGLRRIAGRGADAFILFPDQLIVGQRLIRRVAPEFRAHPLMHPFGEGFREAVGQCLHQDGGVVVVGVLEACGDFVLAEPGGDGEAADIVGDAALLRRDEIRQRRVMAALAFFELLAQRVIGRDLRGAALVAVDGDIVADAVGGPEADHA